MPSRAHRSERRTWTTAIQPALRQWYAIWTRSRHEQVVRDQLEAEGLRSVPSDHPASGAGGRIARRRSTGRCFRGTASPGSISAIGSPSSSAPGVVSIVSFDGEIAPIPEREIDGIRQLVESDLQYDSCPLIHEGMMVEVVHGPLKGVVGRLRAQGGARAAGARAWISSARR